DEGDAVEGVAVTESVLNEVGVVARQALTAVDLDGEARRHYPDLGHVEHLQAMSLARRGLPRLRDVREEAVELRGGNPVRRAVVQRQRLLQQAPDVAAGDGRGREHPRAQPELAVDPRALGVELRRADAAARPRRLLDVAAG